MNVLIGCLFIACFFPYLAKIPAAIAMKNQPEGYDNNYPRRQQANLTDFGARAVAAHQNSFESLLIFSIAALTAIATQHTSATIQGLAIFYLVSRLGYHTLYLLNLAAMRSLVWALGYIACMSMIWMCLA